MKHSIFNMKETMENNCTEETADNNPTMADSAYSTSCSNSQSRKSQISKSTHSGSNSSGSSGYMSKPSTSGSNGQSQPPEKRAKEHKKELKKKKSLQTETLEVAEPLMNVDCRAPEVSQNDRDVNFLQPQENVVAHSPDGDRSVRLDVENVMDDASVEPNTTNEDSLTNSPLVIHHSIQTISRSNSTIMPSDEFSCVISMQDGVVMYTTSSLTNTLGFPKEMWIGRSFIDFVHPKDRSTFASQITSGLVTPTSQDTCQVKVQSQNNSTSMFCRIRKYRDLSTSGFGVKNNAVSFVPYLLKLSFKKIDDDDGKSMYLVIQATPCFSAFKTPNEVLTKTASFEIRHVANGNFKYMDPEAVPFLGYLPQDVADQSALHLYHPSDLNYIKQIYETIVKEGEVPRSKSFRIMAHNGEYVKIETEWSSFINPWSRKLEFVIGKHHVIQGPTNPDVFQEPDPKKILVLSEEEKQKTQALRDNIVRVMNEVMTKPAELAKQQLSKRRQDLATFMQTFLEEQFKLTDDLPREIQEQDHSFYDRDSVMLGGISPHHDYNDSKSSTETPVSYNQLNYSETLQRYFNSYPIGAHEVNVIEKATEVNALENNRQHCNCIECLKPPIHNSTNLGDTSSGESSMKVVDSSSGTLYGDYMQVKLTETLLNKHNAEMEKVLIKRHRETSRGEREKTITENRHKKKEYLSRCANHGVKRNSRHLEYDSGRYKHHKPAPRPLCRRQNTETIIVHQTAAITKTTVSQWTSGSNSGLKSQPREDIQHIVGGVMSQMVPVYYVPTPNPLIKSSLSPNNTISFPTSAVQYMMYPHAVLGPPFTSSSIKPPVSMANQTGPVSKDVTIYSNALTSIDLDINNYKEVCKSSILLHSTRPSVSGCNWRDKKKRCDFALGREKLGHVTSSNALDRGSGQLSIHRLSGKWSSTLPSMPEDRSSESSKSRKSTEAVPDVSEISQEAKSKTRLGSGDETTDRTDGASSCSSFYSSLLKTPDSGSTEDNSDCKSKMQVMSKHEVLNRPSTADDKNIGLINNIEPLKNRRKMEPPWLEQVHLTPDLIYKYQITTKDKEDVLAADLEKMNSLKQSNLVNQQLGQLYSDLQLAGVTARLTLDERSMDDSSEDENISAKVVQRLRRKRKHNKLVMIYQEDAPLPSPDDDVTAEHVRLDSTEVGASCSQPINVV